MNWPWTNVEKKLKKLMDEPITSTKTVTVEQLMEDIFNRPTPWYEKIYYRSYRFLNDLVWTVYRFFDPCHKRIRNVIPRKWCDLTELTLLVNFEIIKSFVEEEMHIIEWSSDEAHKRAAEWLNSSYKYITEVRKKLEDEMSEAYDNLPEDNDYYVKYKEVIRIETTIHEMDKDVLIGLANYREYLWS